MNDTKPPPKGQEMRDYIITIRVRGDYPGDIERLARKMVELPHHPASYDWAREEALLSLEVADGHTT